MVKPEMPAHPDGQGQEAAPNWPAWPASAPKVVKSGICQQVVLTEDANLFDLPIIKCWPARSANVATVASRRMRQPGTGRFITLGWHLHEADPDAGTRNVGMYRVPRCYGSQDDRDALAHAPRRAPVTHRKHKERGDKRMPLAIVLGGEPVLHLRSHLPRCRRDVSELLFAGFLNGKRRWSWSACKTIPTWKVPANAEIVIEGLGRL